MRRIRLIVVIGLVAMGISSCKKEEKSPSVMVGTWNVDKITARVFVGEVEPIDLTMLENQGLMVFEEDNTGSYNNVYNYNWSLTGDVLVLNFTSTGGNDFLESITEQPGTLTTKESDRLAIEYRVDKVLDGIEAVVLVVFQLSRLE